MDGAALSSSTLDPRLGNLATLGGTDDYALYFNQLLVAFQRLVACYEMAAAESHETEAVRSFIQRMLFDIELLRIKYTHHEQPRNLWVDLTDSGFPNHAEIATLATDLLARTDKLQDLPASNLIRRMLIDHIIQNQTDSPALLAQLARRVYLEKLEGERLFLPYTPGVLRQHGGNDASRNFSYAWGCYDFSTNRPYVHVMSFEQDMNCDSLAKTGTESERFFEVMRAEGSRAPDLAILAMAIDEAIESVHPKIIKRVCIGPLYSRTVLGSRPAEQIDEREALMLDALRRHAPGEDDVILFFTDEMIVSKRQEISRSVFSPMGKVREIFYIPETDLESYRRRVTVVHHSALLPHSVAQHLDAPMREAFPQFGGRLLTYDRKGTIHGI